MSKAALLSRAGLAFGVLLLAACAHTPKPNYYVLSGPSGTASEVVRDGRSIGLGPIALPDYLDRPQIVTRDTDSRLHLSNEHRWAEPLSASFSRALLTHLEKALPGRTLVSHPWRADLDIARQVHIDVTRFDRDAGGSFHLSARWNVTGADGKEASMSRSSDIEVPVNGKVDDYDALITAANGAVAALANSIATQLKAP